MQNTVELPESIYRRTEEAARARGVGVDELISEMLERELAEEYIPVRIRKQVSYPILPSNEPGSMDLSDFNFDDLLT